MKSPARTRILAAVFILFAAAASLYGKGAQEDTVLSRADELVTNKNYDEAIRLLSDYAKENPERCADAPARLQKIVQLRNRYNDVANELLDTLESDPENSERILELSNILLTIESSSNPATARFLMQVRYIAELNVNRRRLERVLAAARTQLEENDFSGALSTYASGLDIYQREYFSSGYGQEAEAVAANGLAGINNNIQRFDALAEPFLGAAQALVDMNGPDMPDPGELTQGYQRLFPLMNDLYSLSESFLDIRQSFDAQLAVLQETDNTLGDRSFLSFAGRLLTGPIGQNEGMTGTLDRFWHLWVGRAETAMLDIVRRSYSSGYEAMENRDYTGAASVFDETTQYIAAALEMVRAWDTFLGFRETEPYSVFGETVSGEKAGSYFRFRTMELALNFLKEAGDIGSRALVFEDGDISALAVSQEGSQEGALDAGASAVLGASVVSREQSFRQSLQGLINEIGELETRIGLEESVVQNYGESFTDLPGTLETVETAGTYLAGVRTIVTGIGSRLRARNYDSTLRQYTIANGDLEQRFNARREEFSEGNYLIQGIPREMEGGGVSTVYHLAEGLAVLDRMSESLGVDIAAARELVSRYDGESQELLAEAEVNALYVSARDMLAGLLRLQPESAEIITAARTQIQRAASLKAEGDRLFEAARTALGRNDFDAARTSLERSVRQYDASLAIQESNTLREFRDTQPVLLGIEIVDQENAFVVREVRTWLTEAQAEYYANNMDRAEELLVRAQNRWRVTNATENQEIENWLTLIQGTQSVLSGRTIAPTAPLYAEMSQLLSEARRNYDEGNRLLGSGRRTEGFGRFDAAMENTREVMLVFPMNQDARLLELRIEQQRNPEVFNTSFRQRINAAVAGTKSRNLESYTSLLDLAGINPGFPGIQAIVLQAQVDMGFRPPEPDQRALARSAELARNAQAIINARDTIRYEAARTWLQEAIQLNRNNAQAQTLIDQINILMTGQGTIILPADVMNQYNSAQQEYLRGNYLMAGAIVNRLLQNPEYQNSIQLQDLKRRIDAVQ